MREIIITTILCMLCADIAAQSISITEISPDSEASLAFGRQVTISFEYEMNNSEGVRIFVRPFTSGSLTPNYSASGSPVYRGRGRGSANFTIQSKDATVDQIRVRAVNTQNDLLFEFFLPVKLNFFSPRNLTLARAERLAIIEAVNAERATNQNENTSQERREDRFNNPLSDFSTDEEIIDKKVKPDGTLELHYSDGSIVGIFSPGSSSGKNRYRIDPATGDTTYSNSPIFFIQVQADNPPGFVGSESAVDGEWLQHLNSWIEHHGNRLLRRIDNLLDEESYAAYMSYEENADLSMYEKVNFRYTFLEHLTE
jgi:hypothetical protein